MSPRRFAMSRCRLAMSWRKFANQRSFAMGWRKAPAWRRQTAAVGNVRTADRRPSAPAAIRRALFGLGLGCLAALALAAALAANGRLAAAAPAAAAPAPAAAGGEIPAPAAHAYVDYTIPQAPAADPLLPRIADAASAGLDPQAVTHLLLRARLLHSDAVVILVNGRLLTDVRLRQPAEPIELMSVTKSMAGLAIGRLLHTGRISSLDEPVSHWYPEWRTGPRQAITLRQLMNHTSGLRAQPSAEDVYASSDLLRLALGADLAHPPGSRFFYNNRAVNLLAGIVEKASGRKLDEFMRDEIFAPLGVSRFSWMRDPAGNPHVLAGLKLDALDLARIGQLMLDQGVYRGQRLVAAEFVRQSVTQAQPHSPTGGLLWWVLPEWTRLVIDAPLLDTWRRGGAAPDFLAALVPISGREISRDQLFARLGEAFGKANAVSVWVANVAGRDLPTPRVLAGPAVGFDANGTLGQYLVVIPAARLVAVRQIRLASHENGDDFDDFPDLVRALVPAAARTAQPAGPGGH
jgi:CubicO group peptidase (beta-lactamase class C family)